MFKKQQRDKRKQGELSVIFNIFCISRGMETISFDARQSTLNEWSRGEQWILFFPENLNVSLDFVSGNI